MTVQTTEDPFATLDPPEREQADYVLRGATVGSDLAVAASLGGAFLVYTEFMRRRLRRQLDKIDATDPEDITREAQRVFNSFIPTWTAMVGPVLLRGYLNGIQETGLILSNEFLQTLADNYAYSLGLHLNNVSADALVKGYAAQVNRKVPAKIALANVVDAFGVTNKTARALNNILSAKEDAKLSETLMPSMKKMRAQALIAASIKERADVIGEQESWNARQQGKQVVWLYAQRRGLIPANATRSWLTADDERVCPHCGPMHKAEVPITEPFEVGGVGKFWSPPLHPRCRCEVKLNAKILSEIAGDVAFSGFQRHWMDDPEVAVAKADEWEPREHPRSQDSGRFVRAGFAEPEQADLSALLRDAELRALVEAPAKQSLINRSGSSSLINRGGQKNSLIARDKSLINRKGSLSSGGLGADRLQGKKLKKQALDPAAAKRSIRMARAKMDGRIAARGDDITGEVEKPNAYVPPNYEGLVRTEVPMYGVIDGKGIAQKNEHVTIDGVEVAGGLEVLGDKLEALESQQDEEFMDDVWDSEREFFDYYGMRPEGGGEFTLDTDSLASVIAWARAHAQNDELVGEDWVDVHVMNYVNQDTGLPIDAAGVPQTEEEEDAFYEHYEWDITGTEPVRVSALAEMLGAEEWIQANQPKIVRLDLVRDNDVAYDPKGLPYAAPVDNYNIADTIAVQVHGRRYDGYHVEPGWVD